MRIRVIREIRVLSFFDYSVVLCVVVAWDHIVRRGLCNYKSKVVKCWKKLSESIALNLRLSAVRFRFHIWRYAKLSRSLFSALLSASNIDMLGLRSALL